MPFISTKTTEALTARQKDQLSASLEQIAKRCLGKGESWVMTGYEDGCSLHFRGSSEGCAYVEVKLFGTPAPAACDAMTGEVCQLFAKELGLSPDRIYVAYYPTDQWGWNGGNF